MNIVMTLAALLPGVGVVFRAGLKMVLEGLSCERGTLLSSVALEGMVLEEEMISGSVWKLMHFFSMGCIASVFISAADILLGMLSSTMLRCSVGTCERENWGG